jgi:cyclophilin family peptidyl-prolyl cis-trans isomerase
MKHLIVIAGLTFGAFLLPAFAADTATAPASAAAVPPAGTAGTPAAKAATTAGNPAARATTSGAPLVQVVTSMGNFTIELNPERAPLTVANFLLYVDAGWYTNTVFHRVVPNFIIQGGGFDPEYNLKNAPNKVVNESGNGLLNVLGAVGMARTTSPHAANSQFYVNLADNPALDPQQTRWGYAVFGRVIQGMDVVERISAVPTGAHGVLKEDVPLKPVVILRIERLP